MKMMTTVQSISAYTGTSVTTAKISVTIKFFGENEAIRAIFPPSNQCRRNEFESGGGTPVRRESGAGHRAGKKILVVPLHFFGSKSTISRFGERFRGGQYSLVSLLFAVLLLTVSPVPSHL